MQKGYTIFAGNITYEQVKIGLEMFGYKVVDIYKSGLSILGIVTMFNDGLEHPEWHHMYLAYDTEDDAYGLLDTPEVTLGVDPLKTMWDVIVEISEPKQDKKEEPAEAEEEEWPEESQSDDKANYEIMVGLNDKDTHTQEVTTQEAIETVGTLLGSCTIQTCIGFYQGEQETSLKVTVYGQHFKEMKCTCQEIRRRLNQECVILTDIKEQESTFIYAE